MSLIIKTEERFVMSKKSFLGSVMVILTITKNILKWFFKTFILINNKRVHELYINSLSLGKVSFSTKTICQLVDPQKMNCPQFYHEFKI